MALVYRVQILEFLQQDVINVETMQRKLFELDHYPAISGVTLDLVHV